MKYLMLSQRDVSLDNYWLGPSGELNENYLNNFIKKLNMKPEDVEKSFQIWHAMHMEMFANIEFPDNDQAKKEIKIIRTESEFVINNNNMDRGDTKILKRGPCESGSILQSVINLGCIPTEQIVPYHRILGCYIPARAPDRQDCAFFSDNEKEFIFMPEGIPCTYI